MTDKPSDPNDTQIPREMTERKKLAVPRRFGQRPMTHDESRTIQRFEILPANAIEDDERKSRSKTVDLNEQADSCAHCGKSVCSRCGQKLGVKKHMNSENYQQMYLEQQKTAPIEQSGELQELREKRLAEAAKKAMEQKHANEQRARAREIQNQIAWWNQQRGMGQHDEQNIDGQISLLQSELNGILPEFWT